MAEYIDLDGQIFVTDTNGREHESTVRRILERNHGVYSAADVRPVVFCRDCKHSAVDLENMRYCKCVTYYNHVQDDWFCADGEKREEN